jgi:hypothetical protein
VETSGARKIWSGAHLEQVGPRSIRIGSSMSGQKRGMITPYIPTSTPESGFLVFVIIQGSWDTFQTRFVVMCN